MYHSNESKNLRGNTSIADFSQHHLAGKVHAQGQPAQYLRPDEPFQYLGVYITMDLNWAHQIQHLTLQLTTKLTRLRQSYASQRQTMDIICTAIIPSIAYAFPVTPCSPQTINTWDSLILAAVKHKFKLWACTSNALLREDKQNFGMGCTSVAVEYHNRNAAALALSLNDQAGHGRFTKILLQQQTDHILSLAQGQKAPH